MYYVAERWSHEGVEGKAPLTPTQAIAFLQSNPSPYARRQVIDEHGRTVSVDELERSLARRQQDHVSGSEGAQQGVSQLSRQTLSIGRRLKILEW